MKNPVIVGAILLGIAPFVASDADAKQPKPGVRARPGNAWEEQLRAGSSKQCALPGSRQVAQAQRERGLCGGHQ